MTTAILAIVIFIVSILSVLVAGLLRSHASILRALYAESNDDQSSEGPSSEVPGPRQIDVTDIVGETLDGVQTDVALTSGSSPALLAFLSTGCLACHAFWRAFGEADKLAALDGTELVVVTKGRDLESPSELRKLAASVPDVRVVMSQLAWEAYAPPVVPFFFAIDRAHQIVSGSGSATDWAQMEKLVLLADADSKDPTGAELSQTGAS